MVEALDFEWRTALRFVGRRVERRLLLLGRDLVVLDSWEIPPLRLETIRTRLALASLCSHSRFVQEVVRRGRIDSHQGVACEMAYFELAERLQSSLTRDVRADRETRLWRARALATLDSFAAELPVVWEATLGAELDLWARRVVAQWEES